MIRAVLTKFRPAYFTLNNGKKCHNSDVESIFTFSPASTKCSQGLKTTFLRLFWGRLIKSARLNQSIDLRAKCIKKNIFLVQIGTFFVSDACA